MEALRNLPKIDKLINNILFRGLNKKLITKIAQQEVSALRKTIQSNKPCIINEDAICENILLRYHESLSPSLRPLINATGVVLHTNLGRAPLHEDIFEKTKNIACGYSNLEYDLAKGKRGERYLHVSKQLQNLLHVEDAIVVNNNAAAVFLVLNTFAQNKEVVVSRGELVEIGGSFRVPDVMAQSGCKLKEIGTTNKTKIEDYEKAISHDTSILMKVHRSNFSMQGFTEEVSFESIVSVAKSHNLIDYYDAGGAYMKNLPHSIEDETLQLTNILASNPSLVSFSGDKLLGGIQAGIIVGKKEYIAELKKNQLLRMLRVGKVTLALLEATLIAYMEEQYELIPSLHLLNRPITTLEEMVQNVKKELQSNQIEIVSSSTYVGGGTMPSKTLPTSALHIKGDPKKLHLIFRKNGVIGRIEKESFLLDFKSVQEKDIGLLVSIIKSIL